jgi:phage/plasmid-associated DNA primase
MCNHTPKIEGDDPGLQRRIRKIDYMSAFKESQYVDEENFV